MIVASLPTFDEPAKVSVTTIRNKPQRAVIPIVAWLSYFEPLTPVQVLGGLAVAVIAMVVSVRKIGKRIRRRIRGRRGRASIVIDADGEHSMSAFHHRIREVVRDNPAHAASVIQGWVQQGNES